MLEVLWSSLPPDPPEETLPLLEVSAGPHSCDLPLTWLARYISSMYHVQTLSTSQKGRLKDSRPSCGASFILVFVTCEHVIGKDFCVKVGSTPDVCLFELTFYDIFIAGFRYIREVCNRIALVLCLLSLSINSYGKNWCMIWVFLATSKLCNGLNLRNRAPLYLSYCSPYTVLPF